MGIGWWYGYEPGRHDRLLLRDLERMLERRADDFRGSNGRVPYAERHRTIGVRIRPLEYLSGEQRDLLVETADEVYRNIIESQGS